MTATALRTVTLGLAFLLTAGAAAPPVEPKNFDTRPRNGLVDAGEEERVYAIHLVSEIHARYDANRNGRIDPDEAKEMDRDAANDAEFRIAALQDRRTRTGQVTLDEAKVEIKEALPPKPGRLFGLLLLRHSFEDLVYLRGPAEFKKASGATIGFSNDRLAGKRTREAHGVIFYPLRESARTGDGKGYFVGGSATALGLGADLLTNSAAPKNDFDLLSARLLHEIELRGGPDPLPAMYLRFSTAFTTDTQSDSKQGSMKFQWEPSIPLLGGRGVSMRILGDVPLEMRTRWMLQAEGGRVFDAGEKIGLETNSNFWRSGPKIKTEFFSPVSPLDRGSLSFSWQYLSGGGTGLHDAHLIETSLLLPLDATGHGTIELTYRKGQDPTNGGNRIDTLTFSTGIKY